MPKVTVDQQRSPRLGDEVAKSGLTRAILGGVRAQRSAAIAGRNANRVGSGKAVLATFLVGVCIAAPVVSTAQQNGSETGTRLPYREAENKKALSDRAVVRGLQQWAECVYQKRDRTVVRMLTTIDMADFENAADLVYKGVTCDLYVAGSNADRFAMNTSLATDRGLFAEAALRKKGDLKPNATLPAALPMAEGYNRAWFAMTSRSNTIDAMSICFAETQPALTVALLRTDRKSPEENAAIGDIAGLLGPCLSAGASLNANAFQLRNALADAYFQRIYGNNEPIVVEQDDADTAAAGAEN